MKTPMQQMIDATNEAIQANDIKNIQVALVLQAVKFKAEKLLEAEKEQIMEAWDNGNKSGTDETMGGLPDFYMAEEYYNLNFKSDE